MRKDYDYKSNSEELHTTCRCCGKPLYILDKVQYVYKRDEPVGGKIKRFYFCSWSCLCKYDRNVKEIGNPRLSFWCDLDLRRQLSAESVKNKMTVSQVLVSILRKYYNAQKEGDIQNE